MSLFTNSLENAIRQIVPHEAEEFERINYGANARRVRAPYITRIITIDHRGAEENCGRWYMNGETYGAHVVSMIPFTWTIIRPVSPRIEILLLFFLSLLFLSFSSFFFLFYKIHCHALRTAAAEGLRAFRFALARGRDKWNFARLHLCRGKKIDNSEIASSPTPREG